ATPSAHILCLARPALKDSVGAPSSAPAVLAVLRLVFDLLAALLDVLSGAGHGVAGRQRGDGEQAQQGQCNDALHVGSLVICRTPRAGWAPLLPDRRRSSVNPSPAQSRMSVGLPNRLSTRCTASSAVRLRLPITAASWTVSSEPMCPLSAIISITSCASR